MLGSSSPSSPSCCSCWPGSRSPPTQVCVLKRTVDAVVEDAFLKVAAAEDGFVRDKESRELNTHTHFKHVKYLLCLFGHSRVRVRLDREVLARDPRVRGGGGRRQGDLGPDRLPPPGRHVLRRHVGGFRLRLRVLARDRVRRLRLLAQDRGPVPRQHLRPPARRWRSARRSRCARRAPPPW